MKKTHLRTIDPNFRRDIQVGGGFKYFLFSSLVGEDSHFDEHIFQAGGSTTSQSSMVQRYWLILRTNGILTWSKLSWTDLIPLDLLLAVFSGYTDPVCTKNLQVGVGSGADHVTFDDALDIPSHTEREDRCHLGTLKFAEPQEMEKLGSNSHLLTFGMTGCLGLTETLSVWCSQTGIIKLSILGWLHLMHIYSQFVTRPLY